MDRCYSKHSVKNSILNGKKWHYIIERTPLQYKCGSLLPRKNKKKGVGDTQLRLLGRITYSKIVRGGTVAIHVQC